jgi:chromosome segregation ATPase
VFGSKTRTIRRQSAKIERLDDALTETRADLVTERNNRRRALTRAEEAGGETAELRQQNASLKRLAAVLADRLSQFEDATEAEYADLAKRAGAVGTASRADAA